MPELPEVETIARGLQKRIAGDIIESVWIGNKSNLLKSPATAIAKTLDGARIESVRRVGKHLVIDLARNGASGTQTSGTPLSEARKPRTSKKASNENPSAQFIVHLGMTGRMLICSPEDERAKHTHLVATLESGRELRFVDPRRFGKLQVITGQQFKAAGAEPIAADRDQFAAMFRKRNTPIKSALLNQKLLSGIGNIYADESLFRAGIRPKRRAGSLTKVEIQKLYDGIQEVLAEAIEAGGSSVSDYVDSSGDEGFFQLQHRVYQREGEPCLVCKTPIKRTVIAGRSSHYCPHCQK